MKKKKGRKGKEDIKEKAKRKNRVESKIRAIVRIPQSTE